MSCLKETPKEKTGSHWRGLATIGIHNTFAIGHRGRCVSPRGAIDLNSQTTELGIKLGKGYNFILDT
jgi:hypothetical protein